ncbi:MAG TPA: long-chain fatty acid--CoA ligase, partial [Micromonospora sp.]
ALINGNLPVESAAEYIRRLRATGVLTDARHRELLTGHELDLPFLGDVTETGTGDPGAAPAPYRHDQSDPIVITHSSGTTGLPKAIVHSNSTLFAATRTLRLSMPKAQGTDRVLSALPAPHTAGILAVNQALCNRAELLFLSSQAGGHVLSAIERWQPTGVFGFAVTWSELARFDLTKRNLDSVAIWFNTGDSAHEAHIRPLVAVGSHQEVTREGVRRVAGSGFVDGLGSTEMGHSMFHVTHRPGTDRYGRCIGRPHSFAEVAVLDLDGEYVPDGQVGHLGIKSPTLALGYWHDSVTTYRSRLRGYYLTGDLVYRDGDGYYYHMDRAVDSVDLGNGERLYTAMSEERILRACPDVRDCAVSAVDQDGTVVTDVLLLLDVGADPELDRRDAVAGALGPAVAATLRRVEAVADDAIPLGATGKIRKLVLRERQLAGAAS